MPADVLRQIAQKSVEQQKDAAIAQSTIASIQQARTEKEAREAANRELRKGDLPGYGASYKAKVQQQLTQRLSQLKGTPTAKAATVVPVDTTNYIKVGKDEWVPKTEFDKLTTEQQSKLKELGVAGYNASQSATQAQIEQNSVKLSTGEYVSKSVFNSLTTDNQARLIADGITKFNAYQQALYQTFPTAYQAQQQTVGYIQQVQSLQQQIPGIQTQIDDLTKILQTPGINPTYKQHLQMQIDSLKQQIAGYQVTIANLNKEIQKGELDPTWLDILDKSGTTGLNQYIQTNYPGATGLTKTADPTSDTIKEYGTTNNPNIVIEKGGNRLYIGGEWPLTAKYYMTEAPTVTAPTVSKATAAPTIPVTAASVYTGAATALGGTWGKTPETLAVQSTALSAGLPGVISGMSLAQTQTTIAALKGAELARYEAELQAIQYTQGTTSAQKVENRVLDRVQQYLAYLSRHPDETPRDKEGNILVQLGNTGQFMLATEWSKLSRNEQFAAFIGGIKSLSALQRQFAEQVITKTTSLQAAKSLVDIDKTIKNIETKVQQIKQLPLDERIQKVLNIKVTGEDLIKEVLSGGSAITTSFDEDQIKLDFSKAREAALKEGKDLSLSLQEYRQQVLDKQTTAKELLMEQLPFEYVRAGRWDTLQTWQKVVYPALDIAMLIPVAGLAFKGVGAGIKLASTGAKIAALGGKEALEFAAKDAAEGLSKATVKVAAQRELLNTVTKEATRATEKTTASFWKGAAESATKDVAVSEKELAQVTKNSEMLNKMLEGAKTVDTTGAKAYEGISKVERVTTRAGEITARPANYAFGGVITKSTVENWNDLTPAQRSTGLVLAALSLGIVGKTVNLLENIADPFKIPLKAIQPRAVSARVQPGKLFAEKGGGGTVRLVIDETIGTPEEARTAMASLMKQMTAGEAIGKTAYGIKEVKMKGTGFQATVGEVSMSATPTGEIFKEGTGAYGKRSNLEKYLAEYKELTGNNIEVKTSPFKVGADELTATAKPETGVTVQGKEGGMYFGAGLYNKFAHQSAFGSTGKISAGILLDVPGITELPKVIAKKDMQSMEKAAVKTFNSSKYLNREVEGFKKYQIFMEAENVVTNGSQINRIENLRSRLADKLHLNRAEYYTRDPQGRIELFQMYLEGGRTTPYTLKELYLLKGNALKNSLEDMFSGLTDKVGEVKDWLKGKSSIRENIITKEEQLSVAFDKIDSAKRSGFISNIEANKAKADILNEFRRVSSPTITRAVVRDTISELAKRYAVGGATATGERARVETER
ncbi:MAG: hypothetical protein PHQ22_10655, partial [Sulfuricurvum sp.]|nr:hypothetical protein [Sulfuricurvum sp.]